MKFSEQLYKKQPQMVSSAIVITEKRFDQNVLFKRNT